MYRKKSREKQVEEVKISLATLVYCQFVRSRISYPEVVKAVVEVNAHEFRLKPRGDKFNLKVIARLHVANIVR